MSAIGVQEYILILLILIGIPALIFWVWSLVHCIRNKGLTDNMRIIGVLIIVFLGVIGSFIYLVLPKERKLH